MQQNLLKLTLFVFFFLSLFCSRFIQGQEVVVSKGISIRNDFSYEILGKIGENILLYRDKGIERNITAFDPKLEFKWEKKIKLADKKAWVLAVVPLDSSFNTFYAFKEKGKEYLRVNRLGQQAEMIDTSTLYIEENGSFISNDILYAQSEDKSKIALFYIDNLSKLRLFVIDNDSLSLIWHDQFEFNNTNLLRDFRELLINNNGDAIVLLEKNNQNFKKEDHVAEIIYLSKELEAGIVTTIGLQETLAQDITVSFDNRNYRVGVAGLFNDRRGNASKGYFLVNIPLRIIGNDFKPEYTTFDEAFLQDVYGKDKKKNKGLQHFRIGEIVWRRDGGIILVTEMQREFSRRNKYDSGTRINNDYYSLRGWTDFYNEDVVIISVHPDGKEHWKEVLYKKQFSQDDGGVFSSYFLFKTSSRMHLVFNDEIRNNNTVSEYVLDPVGNYRRESLLSTEYQKLKLRFKDAIQLSSNEILVPSERTYNLSLVKIKYL